MLSRELRAYNNAEHQEKCYLLVMLFPRAPTETICRIHTD